MHIRGTLRDLHERKIGLFAERLAASRDTARVALDVVVVAGDVPIPFADRMLASPRPIALGDTWGTAWQSGWFRVRGRVPEDWAGSRVDLCLDVNGELLLVDPSGAPTGAFSTTSIFGRPAPRDHRLLFDPAAGGEAVDLWAQASACSLFGVVLEKEPPRQAPDRHGTHTGVLRTAHLARVDRDAVALWLDVDTLLGVLRAQPADSTRRLRLLRGLSEAADLYRDDPANAALVREHLRPLLASPAVPSAVTAHAVGHAHIDIAWLWPVREGRRKAARTFATQLALLDQYPGYVFGASQPQLYAFVEQDHPALFAGVKAAVAAGRWEPQGAMWVEADCNLPGGESLVRQVLHGKNYFRDRFGVDVGHLWLPDVFGYSAALPQLLRRAGVDVLLTQKLSWSQFNRFPHTTFRWRGIDGSEVLVHFPPEDSYNSEMRPEDLCRAERRFEERDCLDGMLCLFGIGDGGGGPREEFLERARRMHDLEGVPRVRFGPAEEFFDRLRAQSGELPEWSGELYLELHRGTLTAQAAVKRGNRLLEESLRAVEILFSCLPTDLWPAERLDGVWKTVLLHQFHDDLPGSGTNAVYRDTLADYARCADECDRLQWEAASNLFPGDSSALAVVNLSSGPCRRVVTLPDGWEGTDGPFPAQREPDGTVVVAIDLPPLAAATVRRGTCCAVAAPRPELVLENDLVRYEFDAAGRLVVAVDRVLSRGISVAGEPGNRLSLYEDRTGRWDAWDVEIHYEQAWLACAEPVESASLGGGPVRQGLAFELAIGHSVVRQRVTLERGSRRLEFATEVDWRERHRMLRVSFPVAVRADEATYDIQFGVVRRPTHRNTSWDLAKFEACAHRFADLSDHQYGVALLNDGKYGYKVHGHTLDLNLLRAPTYPDADADQGLHRFTYALLPHAGPLVHSDVRDEAAALNRPPLVFAGRRVRDWRLPVAVEGEGVSIEAIKRAERSDDLIVRLVETRGCRVPAVVTSRDARARMVETDLMEWREVGPASLGRHEVSMGPFDVRTFRVSEPAPAEAGQ